MLTVIVERAYQALDQKGEVDCCFRYLRCLAGCGMLLWSWRVMIFLDKYFWFDSIFFIKLWNETYLEWPLFTLMWASQKAFILGPTLFLIFINNLPNEYVDNTTPVLMVSLISLIRSNLQLISKMSFHLFLTGVTNGLLILTPKWNSSLLIILENIFANR